MGAAEGGLQERGAAFQRLWNGFPVAIVPFEDDVWCQGVWCFSGGALCQCSQRVDSHRRGLRDIQKNVCCWECNQQCSLLRGCEGRLLSGECGPSNLINAAHDRPDLSTADGFCHLDCWLQ